MSVLTDFFQKNSTILIPLITTFIPIFLTLKIFLDKNGGKERKINTQN